MIFINNIKAFGFHLIITMISFIFLIVFVITGPTLGIYTTNVISRIFFITFFLALYFYGGMLLDIKKDKRYDFFSGSIIALIGLILFVYTFFKTGMNLNEISEQLSRYWIVFNLYNCPFTVIYFLIDKVSYPILLLFKPIFPSLIMGCGMKYKRLKKK
ncbi:MAG: hypothetical protein FH753_11005 [Firmicutes bacterium]|nr:hypothetical protein [Bacillota bacterium]